MLPRRITSSVSRRSGWTTVFIELALVIFGVLIALQMNNWNTARINEDGAENTLRLLRSEVETNMAALDERMTILTGTAELRRDGIRALQACDPSPEAREAVGDAVGRLTGDIIPALIDSSLRELTRQDRYLDLLSNDFRAALNIYSGRLADERDQLKINFGLMWDEHIIKHPMVGLTMTDGDVLTSKFVVNASLDVLCEDTTFHRQLAMTEGWHQSTFHRMKRFKDWSEEFLTVIDSELAALH